MIVMNDLPKKRPKTRVMLPYRINCFPASIYLLSTKLRYSVSSPHGWNTFGARFLFESGFRTGIPSSDRSTAMSIQLWEIGREVPDGHKRSCSQTLRIGLGEEISPLALSADHKDASLDYIPPGSALS